MKNEIMAVVVMYEEEEYKLLLSGRQLLPFCYVYYSAAGGTDNR